MAKHRRPKPCPDTIQIPVELDAVYQRISHAAWSACYGRGVEVIDKAYGRLDAALRVWARLTGYAPRNVPAQPLGDGLRARRETK